MLDTHGGRRITLEMPGGLRFRSITDASEDGLDHRLTISSDLGEPVPLGTKVHFLTPVRSDADRDEIQHGAVSSEVTLQIVEVRE